MSDGLWAQADGAVCAARHALNRLLAAFNNTTFPEEHPFWEAAKHAEDAMRLCENAHLAIASRPRSPIETPTDKERAE